MQERKVNIHIDDKNSEARKQLYVRARTFKSGRLPRFALFSDGRVVQTNHCHAQKAIDQLESVTRVPEACILLSWTAALVPAAILSINSIATNAEYQRP